MLLRLIAILIVIPAMAATTPPASPADVYDPSRLHVVHLSVSTEGWRMIQPQRGVGVPRKGPTTRPEEYVEGQRLPQGPAGYSYAYVKAQVEFDGPATLAREERRHDVVGFLHTHPQFAASPSRRDVATMRAWVMAFGKPLLCLIRGSDGLVGWRFDDDRSTGTRLLAVEEFPRGLIVGVDDGGKVSSRRAVSRPRKR